MKTEAHILELARKSSLVSNPTVSFLAEGFGNENYLLEEAGKKFVLRMKKSTESQFLDSLEKEYSFLSYFEHAGVDFCPRALFFDPDENVLIEHFIEGALVSQADFSDEQIDQFAQQLHTLFTLDVSAFRTFCEQKPCTYFGYVDPIESLQVYGFNRFAEAKAGQLPSEVIQWGEKSLEENLDYLKRMKQSERSRGFAWGDIQSSLIIDNDGKLHFYDFEHACIADSFGLSYIKIHGSFTPTQLDFLIERCAEYFKSSKESLVRDMNAHEKIVRTNDAIWAALQWSTTGKQEFADLMHHRIELAKQVESPEE